MTSYRHTATALLRDAVVTSVYLAGVPAAFAGLVVGLSWLQGDAVAFAPTADTASRAWLAITAAVVGYACFRAATRNRRARLSCHNALYARISRHPRGRGPKFERGPLNRAGGENFHTYRIGRPQQIRAIARPGLADVSNTPISPGVDVLFTGVEVRPTPYRSGNNRTESRGHHV